MRRLPARVMARADRQRFEAWAGSSNGSARLQAILQAIDDAQDTMRAAHNALREGDTEEARKLLALGAESLDGHIETLKGLL